MVKTTDIAKNENPHKDSHISSIPPMTTAAATVDVAVATSQKSDITLLSSSSTSIHAEDDDLEDDSNKSSDDDDDGDDQSDIIDDTLKQENPKMNISQMSRAKSQSSTAATSSSSRYFVPYRSVGIVCSGTTFDLMTHQNSNQAIIAVPIYNRFHLLQCDKLHPVLVSQTATAPVPPTQMPHTSNDERSIQHIISDPSMSITIVSHGSTSSTISTDADDVSSQSISPFRIDTITLYHRTRAIQSIKLGLTERTQHSSVSTARDSSYIIVDLLSLGRIQQQQQHSQQLNASVNSIKSRTFGKRPMIENAMVFAVVLAKHKRLVNQANREDETIPTIGYDSSDDDDIAPTKSTTTNEANASMGQIVILVATRTSMFIQRRIMLNNDDNSNPLQHFKPSCAMHPSTYLNKIVVGGTMNGQLAACLLNIRTGKVIHTFQCLPQISTNSQETATINPCITTMEQSPAVDTIAMGTNHGMVYLVNLKHDELLFQLQHVGNSKNSLQRHMTNNSKPDAVTITSISFRTDGSALRYGMSPMAVGRSDGTITIWDLTPPDDPIHFGRTVLCEMKNVHVGGIAKLQFFPQEPLLISTGLASNTIQMHIFDNPDHSGRILRQRKGHRTPPKYIRYLHSGAGAGNGILVNMSDGTDASACQILSSGGLDRTIRVFSTVRSVLDKEYSQGRGIEKRAKQIGLDSTAELLLPPLIGMSMCEARTRDWGDLVTIHKDHAFAYVWSTKRGVQSGPVLRQLRWNVSAMKKPPPTETHATAVTISACGSFALIGTKGGIIYKYNVQSGIARGSFPRSAANDDDDERYNKKKEKTIGDVNRTMKAIEKTLKTNTRSANLDKKLLDAEANAKHENYVNKKLQNASHLGHSVTGLAVDILNKALISVGMDSKLIVWNLMTQSPHQKCPYMLPQPATKLCHVRESDLAAIALQDNSVILFDCSSLYIVRRFGTGTNVYHKHTASITDLCFSGDGRSLYTSSMDSTIRVWDVPTNKCVDWLAFKSPPTSLTISPTGQYLATTHVGKVGINLWSDKSFYETVHVDGEELNQPAYMDEPSPNDDTVLDSGKYNSVLPGVSSDQGHQLDESDSDDTLPIVAKEKGLITLSGLPVAHWKNLFHLELVKQRNKPREPPKKPPTAPFFLQWRGEEVPVPEPTPTPDTNMATAKDHDEDEEWAAAWSDDDGNENSSEMESNELKRDSDEAHATIVKKRPKISHFRSHIASLLAECNSKDVQIGDIRYHAVTEYIATLGPSAIDVALSSLCNGLHDLNDGLPLLLLAAEWLKEACFSRQRFEAINSYLHRFLYIHSLTIAGIESNLSNLPQSDKKVTDDEILEMKTKERDYERLLASIEDLKKAQQSATDDLRIKMDHTLCLLRHFSRMI